MVRCSLLILLNFADDARYPHGLPIFSLFPMRRTKCNKTSLTIASLILSLIPTRTLG